MNGAKHMITSHGRTTHWVALLTLALSLAAAQTAYQPKFPGDPARSDSEAAALGQPCLKIVGAVAALLHQRQGSPA